MNESKWAKRKIRKGGRVKIGGYWWEPDKRFKQYDGRLDGMIYVFGRYRDYSTPNGYINLLDMWGTKEKFDAVTKNYEKLYEALWNYSPEAVVERDGQAHLPWTFWHQVGTQRDE